MSFSDFTTLEAQLNRLVKNGQFVEALDLITHEGFNFPNDFVWVDYWRMYTAAGAGNYPLVFQVAEKSLADGFWYGEAMWRRLPSFGAIQDDPSYERIANASRAVEERDTPLERKDFLTRLPEDYKGTSPLLVALHGNQQTPSLTLPFWKPAVSHGWVLALLQSTQAMYRGAYCWDDIEIAYTTVNELFSQLKQQLTFDSSRVILAGHSMGGLVAIQLALMGTPDVRGFVAIGPAVPFLDAPEVLDSLLNSACQRGVRGTFIVGVKDTDIFVDKIHALSEKLGSAGIECELETIPNSTHHYSPAYDAALIRALEFVDASE